MLPKKASSIRPVRVEWSTPVRATLLMLLFSLSTWGAAAGEFGTKEEAVAMVKRVQAKFRSEGAEATFRAVSDQSVREFHDRDLYPFIFDMEGVNVADGARPALIGKNLMTLKDQDGKFLVRDMRNLATAKGAGWYDHKWPNPLTNKIEVRITYVERMGDYWVGVGVYR
jgi:signal transduction histidine kinase